MRRYNKFGAKNINLATAIDENDGERKNPSANPGVCVLASVWVHVCVFGEWVCACNSCFNLCKLEKAFRMSQVYLGQLVHMQVCFKGCLFCLFVLLLYVPSQQLWSLQDGQFT